MPHGRPLDIHRGRPTSMWGLPGCGPYAVVLSLLCVALFIAGIVRGDPAAIVIGVALILLFAPLVAIAVLARRPDAWTDQVPQFDDEPPDTPDMDGHLPRDEAGEAGRRDTP